MSRIKPFRGYRPKKELAAKVASFPYDVVNSEEARKLAEGNPYSFLHVGKPEIDLDPSVSLYDDRVYAKGVENLQKLIADGILSKDENPCLYLYQQKMGTHIQSGLVCLCSVKEYENDLIKKHEHTRKVKEDDRTRHVMECNANAEPVFLAYRASGEIDDLANAIRERAPIYDLVTEDGIGHTVWTVSDPGEIESFLSMFSNVSALYVADGHHRTAAAARTGQALREKAATHTGEEPFEYFMAVLFPHDQLQILDYNRVVKDLGDVDEEAFLARIGEKFDISDAERPKPDSPKSFGMFLGGKWYRLEAKAGSFPEDDPIKSLDVSILQENLLSPILGIEDPRTDSRIDFVGGIRGMSELEKRCEEGWAVAFAMVPTTIDQLMAVADADRVMPPKSTWFEPKLRSGLIVRLIED